MGVHVVRYIRNPKEFFHCLQAQPDLSLCRDALEAAGHKAVVGVGAQIFVRPEHYLLVIGRLATQGAPFGKTGARIYLQDLRRGHVVASDEFQNIVDASLQSLSGRLRAKPRERVLILLQRPQDDVPTEPAHEQLVGVVSSLLD